MTVLARTAGAIALLIASAGSASQAAAQSAPLKLAYINSQKVLSTAPGRAEAEATFEKEMATYRATMQKMQDSLKTMVDNYTKAEATLSGPVKATRSAEIQKKEQEYQTRAQAMQKQAQDRENELVRPIMENINAVIEQIRKESGYAIVFDVGSNTTPVVAADPALDISDVVIARLKTTATPPVAATPTAPAAPTPKPGAPVASPAGVTRPPRP